MGQLNSLFDKRLKEPYFYFIANYTQDKKEEDERTEKDRVERLKYVGTSRKARLRGGWMAGGMIGWGARFSDLLSVFWLL